MKLSAQWDYLAANAQTVNCCTVGLGSTGNNITTNFWGASMTFDDDVSTLQNIGFDFLYDGVVYNTFVISTNGFIKLGTTAPAVNDYNVSFSGETNVIALLNMDLQPGVAARIATRITTLVNGTKICWVEWTNMQDKNGIYSQMTFQLRLLEASHEIQMRYFTSTSTEVPGIIQPYIGIIGNSISNSVSVIKGTTDQWLNATYVDGPTTSTFSTNQIIVPLNQSNYRFRSTSFLPVTLQSFNAVSSASSVKLSWVTSQEVNADRFEIQRSRDGINFESISEVTAIGNSSTPSRYSYYDRAPLQGLNFYRLKMVDLDQRFTWSDIRRINFSNEAFITITNPVTNILHIAASGISNSEKPRISIYDFTGRLLLQKDWNNYPGDLNINVSSWKSGMYLMQTLINDEKVTKKFLKL